MTNEMMTYLEKGAKERTKLSYIGQQIAHTNFVGKYPHHYIYSSPGLGKTHTVNNAMLQSGVKFYMVTGNVSMFAFGLQLAVIHMLGDKDQVSIISVDDCNELFRDAKNINIMKNVLGENRVFHYQKNLGGLFNQLDEVQQNAIKACVEEGVSGFKVPTDKMIFVFTANEKLPTDSCVSTQRDRHLLAIRDRSTCHDFDMEPMVQWGWIADCILNTDACSFVLPKVREEALTFMYDNWKRMSTRSIRTIIKMCEDTKKFPNNYVKFWEAQYIK